MKKLTKKDKFEMMLGFLEGRTELDEVDKEMLAEFVEREMDLLSRRNATTGDRKPSKVQLANEGLLATIEETMSDFEARTITEIQELNAELKELSNQKMSALLKKLVDCGKMEKFVEKKKTYFKMKNEQ